MQFKLITSTCTSCAEIPRTFAFLINQSENADSFILIPNTIDATLQGMLGGLINPLWNAISTSIKPLSCGFTVKCMAPDMCTSGSRLPQLHWWLCEKCSLKWRQGRMAGFTKRSRQLITANRNFNSEAVFLSHPFVHLSTDLLGACASNPNLPAVYTCFMLHSFHFHTEGRTGFSEYSCKGANLPNFH